MGFKDIFDVTTSPNEGVGVSTTFRSIKNDPLIVNADHLNELVDGRNCSRDHFDNSYKVLRFLLRRNGELVFAGEGRPRGSVPAHFQMANKNFFYASCITAGNIFINANNEIECINHKSGDFRPSFDSLQFAIYALLDANQLKLADALTLHKLDCSGRHESSFKLSMSSVRENRGTYPSFQSYRQLRNTIAYPRHQAFSSQLIHKEILRLQKSNTLMTYLGLIRSSQTKIDLLKQLLKTIPEEMPANEPATIKEKISDFYREHQNALTLQRNKLHTFFRPHHQTETEKMFQKVFSSLNKTIEDKPIDSEQGCQP